MNTLAWDKMLNMLKNKNKVKFNLIKNSKTFLIIGFSICTFSVFSGIVNADSLNDALKCMLNFSKVQNSNTPTSESLIVLENLIECIINGMNRKDNAVKLLIINKKKLFDEHFSQEDFRFLLINSVWSAFLAGKGEFLVDLEELVDINLIKDFPSSSYRLEVLIGIGGLHLLKTLENFNCCNKLWSIEMLALNMPDLQSNQISFENIKSILVDLVTRLERLLK